MSIVLTYFICYDTCLPMSKCNSRKSAVEAPITTEDVRQLENIELLFFAYRDFISDPDRELAQYEFGRAHHRVLFFVNRRPGLTVAELLEILQITKQSLARVLKQLIEKGYIVQEPGENDRRKRLLFPTHAGRELILNLSKPQSLRIEKAFASIASENRDHIVTFLRNMINQHK